MRSDKEVARASPNMALRSDMTAGRRRHSACRRGVSRGTPAHVPGIARVEAHRPCAGTGVRVECID